jgi:deoxyribose-phosphate aldolase
MGVRAPLSTYDSVAGLIDHSLLKPQLTAAQVTEGLELAMRYRVASATVRPCDVELSVSVLQGSGVPAGSVVGFPHGSATPANKLSEARELLRRGAREIDMVLSINRLLSGDYPYVRNEVSQLAEACHGDGAILKVIFENAYLTDELKIAACRICEEARADFVKTSTGFAPSGYTVADIKLMRANVSDAVQVKAASGLRTLDHVIEVYELGATRVGLTVTAAVLDEWKARLAAVPAASA